MVLASSDRRLRAPVDGVVAEVDPSGGTIVLVTEQGTELRMSVKGVGSELPGSVRIGVSQGQKVSRGEVLARLLTQRSRPCVRQAEVHLDVRVGREADMVPTRSGDVRAGDHLLAIV